MAPEVHYRVQESLPVNRVRWKSVVDAVCSEMEGWDCVSYSDPVESASKLALFSQS